MILGTCWTSFVFISMLKIRYLLAKIAMLFFLTSSSSPYPLTLEFTEQRAGSQLIIFRIIIRIIIIKAQLSSYISSVHRDQMAGFQNVLQLFVSNTAHLFLLEVCNRSTATWWWTSRRTAAPGSSCCSSCSRREHSLGGRLSRAIFQTLIVTWTKVSQNFTRFKNP